MRETADELRARLGALAEQFPSLDYVTVKKVDLAAIDGMLARLTAAEDPFSWVGTWHVQHADGVEEDIVLEHGNLLEDLSGSCGQFLLALRDPS